MIVKKFLGIYNIGRSTMKKATVVNTDNGESFTYYERELKQDLYGSRFGDLKVITFTITENEIIIYARF